MISVVMIAIIGHEVFPGNAGWWLFYAFSVCMAKMCIMISKMIKSNGR